MRSMYEAQTITVVTEGNLKQFQGKTCSALFCRASFEIGDRILRIHQEIYHQACFTFRGRGMLSKKEILAIQTRIGQSRSRYLKLMERERAPKKINKRSQPERPSERNRNFLTEKAELLAVVEKRLTKRGPYGYAIDLPKKALEKGREMDCEESGTFQKARDYFSQVWRFPITKIPGGYRIEMLRVEEEEENGQSK